MGYFGKSLSSTLFQLLIMIGDVTSLSLIQETNNVQRYASEFTSLARYVPDLVRTKEQMIRHFI